MRTILITVVVIIFSINNTIAQKTTTETSDDIMQITIPASVFIATLILNNGNKNTLEFAKTVGFTFILTHFLKNAIDK